MAFRWAGDANIAIAIELPAGGEHTRLVPKVTDLQVAGVARVMLDPLVPIIPGFGAAVVALRCGPLSPLLRQAENWGRASRGLHPARGPVPFAKPGGGQRLCVRFCLGAHLGLVRRGLFILVWSVEDSVKGTPYGQGQVQQAGQLDKRVRFEQHCAAAGSRR